ncbi:putative outer membrane protein [Mycolicibacterium thermoresistibile]|uniref:Putative outer membrane protein n=1 Tax=Mycolicibacterium thermoresistibile TaxID=1797 RepID=A0A100XDQ3_MYCTH|nr:putative outer membrane protein [Mycolicibacterium thermoresistibile]
MNRLWKKFTTPVPAGLVELPTAISADSSIASVSTCRLDTAAAETGGTAGVLTPTAAAVVTATAAAVADDSARRTRPGRLSDVPVSAITTRLLASALSKVIAERHRTRRNAGPGPTTTHTYAGVNFFPKPTT